MDKIRLAMVGAGRRGRSMFTRIGRRPQVDPVAVCELDADFWNRPQQGASKSMSEEFPTVKLFGDFEAMLSDGGFDVLLVETPAYCHAEFCAKALSAGVHVYSDIPSVASLQEADLLWRAQAQSKAMLMTGATTMGWGFVLALQDLHRQGFLGRLSALEAEYIHDVRYLWEATPWRKPGAGGRTALTYCTHGLGPLLSILDEDLKTVTGFTSGSRVTDIPEAHDVCTAIYHTASGIMVRQTNSFINACKTGHHSFRVYGSAGYFEHLSQRGSRPELTGFSSEKLYAAHNYTELPVGFQADGGTDASGHGGADSYIWGLFEKTLLEGGGRAPIDLKAGLRMTIPGIYADRSVRLGGVRQVIHYPWDADWEEHKAEF